MEKTQRQHLRALRGFGGLGLLGPGALADSRGSSKGAKGLQNMLVTRNSMRMLAANGKLKVCAGRSRTTYHCLPTVGPGLEAIATPI